MAVREAAGAAVQVFTRRSLFFSEVAGSWQHKVGSVRATAAAGKGVREPFTHPRQSWRGCLLRPLQAVLDPA